MMKLEMTALPHVDDRLAINTTFNKIILRKCFNFLVRRATRDNQ